MSPSLIIAPEVLRELGGQDAAYAMFEETGSGFRCAICGDAGRFGPQNPASVLVVVVRDGEKRTRKVKLSHPRCSSSRVRVVRAVTPANRFAALPGAAWLRPADTDPAAVLVIARALPELPDCVADQPGASFLPRLVEHGFGLLSDPDTPLPHVQGLTAWHTPGRLAIYDRHNDPVWDGRLPSSHAWTYAALRSRWLGVVVATGVQLTEPGQARGLYTAITGGRAAGAAIQLADPTPVAARRWPYQLRSYVGAAAPAMQAGAA